jgi:methylthioribose-1-phosphate isomerase
MRTIEWDEQSQNLRIIDQRQLPEKFEYIVINNYKAIAEAISSMAVRGAPAIGVTAAYGMVLAALHSQADTKETFMREMRQVAQELEAARPTAVNLPWALKRMLSVMDMEASISQNRQILLGEAHAMAEEDVAVTRPFRLWAALINDGDTLIHHCNTGALATVDWGTALGCIRFAFEQGKRIHVLVDETRPRLQGARLTAWELQNLGIPLISSVITLRVTF